MQKGVPTYIKVLIISFVAFFLVGLLFAYTLLVAGGVFLKKEYLQVWNKEYYKKYDDPRMQLLSHGVLAPSIYNLQPWQIELSENENEMLVFINTQRIALSSDPNAREIFITMGAFLEYMSIASNELGFNVTIEEFPNGEIDENNLMSSLQTTPIAKVTVKTGNRFTNPLYENLFLPSTNRMAHEEVKLNELDRERLLNTNNYDNINFKFLENDEINNVLQRYVIGTKNEVASNEIVKSSDAIFRSNEYEKNKTKYGFSLNSQGSRGLALILKQGLLTMFPQLSSKENTRKMVIKEAENHAKGTTNLLFITSEDNTRQTMLNVGRTFARFELTCHNLGYVIHPLSAPIQDIKEVEKQREELTVLYGEGNKLQMLVRLGVPTKESSVSMRILPMDIVAQK